jgi:hypothetical protein
MILHLRRFVLSVVSLTVLVQTAAAQVGRGTLAGTFSDAQPTLPTEVLIVPFDDPPAGADWATPRSMGSGTDQYGWGLWITGKYFLDGVETPLGDINALGLSDEDFDARVTKEVGASDNALGFTGLDFVDQPRGETFVAGRLFYHNGVNSLGTSVSSVNLDVQSSSVSPDFSHLLPLKIAIRTSPNVLNSDGTLNNEASADFIFFVDRPDLGSFRVYEQQGTDVEILMEFNSLDLVGFGAVGDPSVGFVSAIVPEPSTACLASIMLPVFLMRSVPARVRRL